MLHYEQHLDDPAYYGIRVNTLKISVRGVSGDLPVSRDAGPVDG